MNIKQVFKNMALLLLLFMLGYCAWVVSHWFDEDYCLDTGWNVEDPRCVKYIRYEQCAESGYFWNAKRQVCEAE